MSNVNYAAPPFDVAEYPVSNDILLCTAEHSPRSHQIVPGGNHHSEQYATHVSSISFMNTRFECLLPFNTLPMTPSSLSAATTVRCLMAKISKA